MSCIINPPEQLFLENRRYALLRNYLRKSSFLIVFAIERGHLLSCRLGPFLHPMAYEHPIASTLTANASISSVIAQGIQTKELKDPCISQYGSLSLAHLTRLMLWHT